MTMPTPPLGRSLIPLPGESLPGFILRLSCRLQLPPARLAALTGLVPAGHSGARAPASLLTEIPEPAGRTFAHMTRLTTEKVAQLGLACLQERYPLPAGAAKNAAAVPLSGLPVFAPATRYCPDCLAGDGSPIQGAFGGPWRKIWHLPVVFACTLHRRLLEDRCPECGQVTHNHPGAPVPMLPAMRAAALRPADPELITLQHKILGLLEPRGPAHTLSAARPAAPARYFTDLQALALLACSTWPAIRHLSPSQETARPPTGMSRHFGNEPQTGRAAPGPQKSAPRPALRPRTPQPAPAWRTSLTTSSSAEARQRSANICARCSPPAPGKRAGRHGAFESPGQRPRVPRACKPPTRLSFGASPRSAASRKPGATRSSARSAGDPSTSRRSSPRTGTTATSSRSTASIPCSPAAPRRSGWCRWLPAARSARPPGSSESQPQAPPGHAKAGSTPAQVTSTAAPRSSLIRSPSKRHSRPSPPNSMSPQPL